MSNALLSDAEARAERRRTRTSGEMWEGLARAAWERGQRERARGALAAACRWLDRARRLAPTDAVVQVSLASVLLEAGQAAEAAPLFRAVAEAHRIPDAWTGLAACELLLGNEEQAAEAAAAGLQAGVPGPSLRAVAAAVAERLQRPGWCGLDGKGVVLAGPGRPPRVALDGRRLRGLTLPPGWRTGRSVEVGGFLGSPLPVRPVVEMEGFVDARDGEISGWAWHPGDPGREPRLLVRGPAGSITVTASEPAEGVVTRPLGRPRRFAVEVATLGSPVSVTDEEGRHLLGSPLDPGWDRSIVPIWADAATRIAREPSPSGRGQGEGGAPEVDVVVPVYRGRAETLACLESLLASVPASTRVHVIEDASPEPALVADLELLAAAGRVSLIRQPENRGFPAAANAGMQAASGRDVVLLNSDTLVPPGWLERLRAAAYSAPDIGTVTPLSNDATIVSYPDPAGGNSVPDLAQTVGLDALAQRANPGARVELPVGVGFCLYLRRDCLDQAGPLREDLFAQGYGEENDLCLRARHLGWRNVAAADVFVAHVGGRSFGAARTHLIRRNTAILNRIHPGYDALVGAHIAADPLREARRRMDALRWAEGRSRRGAVVMVTHAGGGGIDQVIAGRCEALRKEGKRPIVLRPHRSGCRVEGYPNLIYDLPAELGELAGLLRPDRPGHLELHHLLGHRHEVMDLAPMLGIPVETWVHDYALFCPRIALVSRNRAYCGEPDVAGCEDCIADLGGLLEEDIPVRTLLARSTADLAGSRRVVAPSQDAAQRIQRHFPFIRPELVPWERDADLPPPEPPSPGGVTRVCVVGAIGVEKGYDVLLGCVRDAARRALPLEFVVCGFTADDERMLDAGPVFITGEYKNAEAVALIRAQGAQLAFIPSVWPETWCFALSRAWQAGLRAAAFDLGAQAERIRATGRGWLLPLGLPSRAVNDALLSLAPPCPASQSPRPST